MYDNGSCSDNATLTNPYPWAHHNTPAQPGIVFDNDGECCLLRRTSIHIIPGVLWCIKLAVGPNLNMITKRDQCAIENDAAIVDEGMFANLYTMPMVTNERWAYFGGLWESWDKHFYQGAITFLDTTHLV